MLYKLVLETGNSGSGSFDSINLFNSMGKLVYSESRAHSIPEEIVEITLPATCLPGVYFVKVTTGNMEYSGKLMLLDQ
ncbi:MAG: T9SS type A sorting domain-containing protein [Chitinophagaceae bacterium]|nr:T9SS type A sorting domain-containing protein [Chitinophagaceae bacterium]